MDPMLVKGLHQIKEFLDQGIFTQQEFNEQKQKLIHLYPVAWTGPFFVVTGCITGVPQSPVSQP
jgi:hypothetical protein